MIRRIQIFHVIAAISTLSYFLRNFIAVFNRRGLVRKEICINAGAGNDAEIFLHMDGSHGQSEKKQRDEERSIEKLLSRNYGGPSEFRVPVFGPGLLTAWLE